MGYCRWGEGLGVMGTGVMGTGEVRRARWFGCCAGCELGIWGGNGALFATSLAPFI